MGMVISIQPLVAKERRKVIGNLDIVQISKGKMRIAVKSDIRKKHHLCIPAMAVHGIGKLLCPLAGHTPNLDIE